MLPEVKAPLVHSTRHATELRRQVREEQMARTLRYFGATLIAATVVFVALMVRVESRTPTVMLTSDTLSVAAGRYSAKLPVSSIDSVTLSRRLGPIGLKHAGYSFGSVLHGFFAAREYGSARLFVNTSRPPFVTIHSALGVVIVSLDDSASTRTLYDSLAAITPSVPSPSRASLRGPSDR